MPRELKSVKCTKVDRSTGHAVFVFVSTFEGDNGRIENCYVAKTLSDLTNFRKSVLQLSAGHQDSNSKSNQVLLPDVKEKKPLFPGRRDEKNKSTVDDFCQHVVKLPNNLLKEETVVAFFHDSSAANEDGAVELFKAKDSAAGGTKKSNKGNEAKAKQVLQRGDTVTSSSAVAQSSSPSSSTTTTTTTTSSMSPSSAAAAVTTSRLTNVEAAYAEISDIVPGPGPRPSDDLHGRPSISTCEYSEVQPMTMKEGDGRNKRIIFTDDVNNSTYDECDAPGTNAHRNHLETVELRDRPGRPIAEEALYASVFKAKPTATHPPPPNLPPPQQHRQHQQQQQHQHQRQQQPNQPSSNADELYEDTAGFGPLKREEEPPVLYEDAMCSGASYHHQHQQQQHQHQQPPTPPRPRGQSNTSEMDSKLTRSPSKPPVPSSSASAASSAAAAVSSSSFTPLTPIPPMPQFPSPCLINPDTVQNGVDGERGSSDVGSSSSSGVDREIEVVAIGDYESSSDNILSFRRGTLASLILQSDSDWWCIRLASAHGWVPAAYWRMLNTGDCASLITRGNSPWFVGKLSRAECETLLMEHGKQQHFVVRESDSGHYALSIKYEGRIHHFPIEVTADKKYNIGKHDFKSVNNIILYYQKNALFHDEHGRQVTLGSPLVIIKH